jgi:hypothetical protein
MDGDDALIDNRHGCVTQLRVLLWMLRSVDANPG